MLSYCSGSIVLPQLLNLHRNSTIAFATKHDYFPTAWPCYNQRTSVCCCAQKKQRTPATPPNAEVSVFRFTLGIAGFDESSLPRIIGFSAGFLLLLNHFLSQSSLTPAQLRSEAVGLFLSAIAVSLPYFGKFLEMFVFMGQAPDGRYRRYDYEVYAAMKGLLCTDPRDLFFLQGTTANKKGIIPIGQEIFLLSDKLSVDEKEDLAWGTYALLQNTLSTSVLIFNTEVLCARGFWDLETKLNENLYNVLNDKVRQLNLAKYNTTLYLLDDADKRGWKIIPKGVESLLLQSFNCTDEVDANDASHGFILLLSTVSEAYSDKDRAWVIALTDKFKHIKPSTK